LRRNGRLRGSVVQKRESEGYQGSEHGAAIVTNNSDWTRLVVSACDRPAFAAEAATARQAFI
jgi:hypothetical protein